jgi:hypothetical protein
MTLAVVAILRAAFAVLTMVVSEAERSKLTAEMSQLRSTDKARLKELENLRSRLIGLEDRLERGAR